MSTKPKRKPLSEKVKATLRKKAEGTRFTPSQLQAVYRRGQGAYLGLNPKMAQAIINALDAKLEQFSFNNYQPLLLCSPLIRPHVKKLVERFIPNLVVLSHNEVTPDVRIEALGIVELNA